jgi:hypothetical protein
MPGRRRFSVKLAPVLLQTFAASVFCIAAPICAAFPCLGRWRHRCHLSRAPGPRQLQVAPAESPYCGKPAAHLGGQSPAKRQARRATRVTQGFDLCLALAHLYWSVGERSIASFKRAGLQGAGLRGAVASAWADCGTHAHSRAPARAGHNAGVPLCLQVDFGRLGFVRN